MKRFIDSKAWQYYIITLILIIILFLLRNTEQRVVGVAGHFGFSDPITRLLVFGISLIMSFRMGYNIIYSRRLFAVFIALFAYLILPLIAFAIYDRASLYYLMYYIVLGFINIFLPHIILNFIGLGLGSLFRKKHIRKQNERVNVAMSSEICFTLNNEEITYKGNPSARLLDILRDKMELTGTKCGCKEGECGACAVIVNGKLVNSCLVAMGSLSGATVLTIEGYSKTERFAVLDKAYASVSAVQCGFCIPGMMMASESLLSDNPKPTEEEIRIGISGNLCRCTGYNAIVKAIDIAAKEGSGLW